MKEKYENVPVSTSKEKGTKFENILERISFENDEQYGQIDD